MNLLLYERPARSEAFVGNITRHLPDWQHDIRAVGGFWVASGTITEATMNAVAMRDFYDQSIARRVKEWTAGITSWEGEVSQMELTLDGKTERRSLSKELWHNRVKCTFTDYLLGTQSATVWGVNTSSSGMYGGSEYIDTVSDIYDNTSASAAADVRLAEYAYPRSRPAGGLASKGGNGGENSLRIYCQGFVASMNRRYRSTDIAAGAVSDQISTLVGNSEFVTAGRISTNSMTVPVTTSDISQRLWELIEELVLMGDENANKWVGGVYGGRKFHYEQAETAVTHYWRNGTLFDKNWAPVWPSLIKPNIVVQIFGPSSGVPAGGTTLDDPRNVWIEEVEFIAPDQYRLIPAGA